MSEPILTLDFAKTHRFDRRLVFARPSSARRTTASGILRPTPPGQPRLDSAGLLVEPGATNLLLNSTQYDQTSWVINGATAVPAAATAPDGSTTAWKIAEATTTSVHRLYQGNIAAEGLHTASIYVKAAERSAVRLRLLNYSATTTVAANLATGTLLGDSSPGAAIDAVGNGWYRLSVTRTLSGAGNQVIILLAPNEAPAAPYTGVATAGLFVWGAQLEAGARATSPVPTGAATAVRAAESCSLPLAHLPRWPPLAGTLVIEAAVPALTDAPQALATLSDTTGANALRLCLPGGAGLLASAVVDGASTVGLTPGTVGAATRFQAALAWSAEGIAACLNGGAVVAGGSGPPPAGLAALHLGCAPGGGEHVRGWLGRVALYPERLADAELRRLTTA